MAYGSGYLGGYSDAVGLSVTVEVAFGTDPGDTPDWTDVSEYVEGFTVHRGRPDELSAFSAGTARIVLANEDRRFDPTYEDSPYWPNVVPMRRIRIRAAWNGTTYDVFTGYVDSWEQQYAPPQSATCVVSATDAFKVLANIELPPSVYEVELLDDAPTHFWRLGEPAGSTVAFDSSHLAWYDGTYAGGVTLGTEGAPTHDPDGAATFDGVDDYVTFGLGPLVAGNTYTVEMWLKISERTTTGWWTFFSQSRDVTSTGEPWGIVTGTDFGDPGKINWGGRTSTSRIDDGAWHHVALVNNAGTATLYVDGVAEDTGAGVNGTGNEVLLGHAAQAAFAAVTRRFWAGSIDEVATWGTTALSAATIARHNEEGRIPWRGDLTGARAEKVLDAAGWPSADRDIDTGSAASTLQSADLGGTALSVLQLIEQTEFGALFVTAGGLVRFIGREDLLKAPYTTSQATFGDSGSELEYADLAFDYDDKLISNEVQVSRTNGSVQAVRDATSQERYLRRTRVIDGLLHEDDSLSRDAANFVLSRYKDPKLRVTDMRLEPSAGNETTHFPHVLGRELLDRITVKRIPQNLGPAIDQESRIEGITHTVTATEWVTTWNLSPAQVSYWLVGVPGFSEAGVTTRAGF